MLEEESISHWLTLVTVNFEALLKTHIGVYHVATIIRMAEVDVGNVLSQSSELGRSQQSWPLQLGKCSKLRLVVEPKTHHARTPNS